jgi:hypothetical protein
LLEYAISVMATLDSVNVCSARHPFRQIGYCGPNLNKKPTNDHCAPPHKRAGARQGSGGTFLRNSTGSTATGLLEPPASHSVMAMRQTACGGQQVLTVTFFDGGPDAAASFSALLVDAHASARKKGLPALLKTTGNLET